MPIVRPSDGHHGIDRLIFICGLHRSGTTLLEHWLRARFVLSHLRAPVPENEGQFLQDVYPPAKVHGGVGRFAFSPAMYPGVPGPEDAEKARTRLLNCWASWRCGKHATLLEKSPPNLTKILWLRAVFPGAGFILLARDPRAVAAATAKWRDAPHQALIYHWHVAYEAALDAVASDTAILRYEDVVRDPAAEIDRVGAELGLEAKTNPGVPEGRFGTVVERNASYLSGLPPCRYGTGAWERLGYRL